MELGGDSKRIAAVAPALRILRTQSRAAAPANS